MNKIAAYERALVERDTEKLAEQVYEAYAVKGYLPPGYAEVFMAMHKEANLATGAVSTMGKLRNWMMGAGRKMSTYGSEMAEKGLGKLTAPGVTPGIAGELQHTGGKILHSAGNFVQANPYLTAGIGAAGIGYGGYKALT